MYLGSAAQVTISHKAILSCAQNEAYPALAVTFSFRILPLKMILTPHPPKFMLDPCVKKNCDNYFGFVLLACTVVRFRFSEVPKTFRARKAIRNTPTRLFCNADLIICCKWVEN